MDQKKTNIYTPFNSLSPIQSQNLVGFLYAHLQEYSDDKGEIKKAVEYAMVEIPLVGGYIIINYSKLNEIIGAVLVNKAGMGGYIPENILV